MFYCTNILATIDPSCPHVWMEEREEEEDRLTGAIQTRMLLPTELIQLTTFMLNNSKVMEEWRNFYENAKSMSARSRIFPTFHKYMKEKLAEVDQLLAQGESISCFPEIIDDVRTIVHGPLKVVTTCSAMWTQGTISGIYFFYFITVVIRLSPHFFKSASRISPHSVGLKMRINIYGSVYCDRVNPKSKIVICLLPSIFSREIFETAC